MKTSMKIILTIIAIFSLLLTAGCGGSGNNPPGNNSGCPKKPTLPASCTAYKAMTTNNPVTRPYKEDFHQGATASPINCDTAGLCTITGLRAGYLGSHTPKHHDSLRYIDFNTNTFLDIGDKDAMNTNTAWTIGIRGWIFLTNGGIFPGQISVTKVTGDAAAFTAFNLAKAKAIPGSKFIAEDPIDTTTCQQKNYKPEKSWPRLTPMAINRLSEKSDGKAASAYKYDFHSHMPIPPQDHFYVLKDCAKSGWFAKVRVDKIEYNSTENYDMFDLQYQVLK